MLYVRLRLTKKDYYREFKATHDSFYLAYDNKEMDKVISVLFELIRYCKTHPSPVKKKSKKKKKKRGSRQMY